MRFRLEKYTIEIPDNCRIEIDDLLVKIKLPEKQTPPENLDDLLKYLGRIQRGG